MSQFLILNKNCGLGASLVWDIFGLGSSALLLIVNMTKLESYIGIFVFSGHPRETKGGLYSSKNRKVIVWNNVRFLGWEYMKDHKPMNKIISKELRSETPNS